MLSTARCLRTCVFTGILVGLTCAASPAVASPPATPTGLTATATAPQQVTVSWTAVSGATSYNVYRSLEPAAILTSLLPPTWGVSPSAILVANPASTQLVDSDLATLVRYYYAVTAVNSDGESAPAPFGTYVMTTAAANAPIWGFADVHNHQFANLGFGGQMFWGSPFDASGDISTALPWCTPAHGLGGLGDLVNMALGGGFGHAVGGYDQFDGWPRWNSYTHQGAYIDWVERAFLGGMKLMVVHAVNNEVLCDASSHPLGCDDMPSVDRQIAAAKDVAAHVPWYQIAYSPEQARQIINSGNLAVVLGIEVDKLFGCAQGGTCSPDDVKNSLAYYYGQGVRHFFPVHVFDNAYGGAALYEDLFNYGNNLINGDFFHPANCSGNGDYGFTLQAAGFPMNVLAFIIGAGVWSPTGYSADCNSRTLTPLGVSLMRKLMSRKAIIDIDHMDAAMTDAALGYAEDFGYPVVAGHTGFIGTSIGAKRAEGQKTDAQLTRILNLHGLVAPILHQGSTSQIASFGTSVPNDCSNSSKTFAQAYLYAVDRMAGGLVGGAVGLGTDFNGLAGEPGPRFGPEACPGDSTVVPQNGGVNYPFAPFGKLGVIRESVVGRKTFNYNVDGLAHIGMLPDLIEDLRSEGISNAQLEPLFHSAEAYIEMWQNAEQLNILPPNVSSNVVPGPNAAGWNKGNATLTMTGVDNPDPDSWPVSTITYAATGAQSVATTAIAGRTASLIVAAEGSTDVTFSAADDANNHSVARSRTILVDKTAPVVTCGSADGVWHAADAAIPCTANDAVSGLASAGDAAFSLVTSVPAGTETPNASTNSRTITDVAGNESAAGPVSGNRVDKKAPSISINSPAAGTVYVLNQQVAANYGCVDGGSGLATCTGPVPSGSNFATGAAGSPVFTVNATDNVSNASTASVNYVVAYRICALYDQTKANRAGSTIPIKLQLCDYNGANGSTSSVIVTATGVTQISSSAPGTLQDSGSANADNNFRYDAALGGYIFNLQTTGYSTGTYRLSFTASGDPTTHTVEFQVK